MRNHGRQNVDGSAFRTMKGRLQPGRPLVEVDSIAPPSKPIRSSKMRSPATAKSAAKASKAPTRAPPPYQTAPRSSPDFAAMAYTGGRSLVTLAGLPFTYPAKVPLHTKPNAAGTRIHGEIMTTAPQPPTAQLLPLNTILESAVVLNWAAFAQSPDAGRVRSA